MNFKTQSILILKTFIVTSMLASCSALAPDPGSLTPNHGSVDSISCSLRMSDYLASNEVVRYYTFLSTLNDTSLAKEYTITRLRVSPTSSASDRLKLAVLLSIPNTAFHNPKEARDLLKTLPVEETHNSADLSGFTHFLDMLLSQQQQADDRLNELSKSLAEERSHSKLLQEKLFAIKNMEIKMIQREQP